jgi:hypothetical protein
MMDDERFLFIVVKKLGGYMFVLFNGILLL